jgi:hypothetical protein
MCVVASVESDRCDFAVVETRPFAIYRRESLGVQDSAHHARRHVGLNRALANVHVWVKANE